MQFTCKQTKSVALAITALALVLGGVAQARAGLFVTGSQFTVQVNDDPAGNSPPADTNVPLTLNGVPAPIDGGLLTVSETLTPLSASTAWLELTFKTVDNAPLAGNPGGNWEIQTSNMQAASPVALTAYYATFLDANGISTPFPFGNAVSPVLDPNPGGVNALVALGVFAPPYSYSTSQGLFAFIFPFDQSPTFFENGGPTPTTFIIAGEYTLQQSAVVPEPASLTLLGIGAVSLIGYGWRRRNKTVKAV